MRNCVTVVSLVLLLAFQGCGKDYAGLLEAARAARERGDNAAALIHLKNAVKLNPGLMEAHLLLGEVHADRGEAKDGENELRIAVTRGAKPAQYLPALGQTMLELQRYEVLLEEIKTQEDFDSKLAARIALLRGRALLALGRMDDARESFKLAAVEKPHEAMLALADVALALREVALAEKLADDVIAAEPANATAWMVKGNVLRVLEKPQDALAAFDKAVTAKPSLVPALLSRSALQLAAGKPDAARTQIEQARKHAPGSPSVWFQSAVLSLHERNHERCREELRYVFKLIPEHWPSILLSGSLFFATGEIEQAQSALVHYLRRFPANVFGRKLLAVIMLRKGQPQTAGFLLEPILERVEGDAQLFGLAGQAFLQSGQIDKARTYLEKAVVIEPKDAGMRTRLGLTRVAAGDATRGIADLEFAVDLNTGEDTAESSLVGVLIAQGQAARALEVAQAAGKQRPNSARTHQLKGAAQLASLDMPGARASFERALKLDPKFYPAVAALAQMELRAKDPKAARGRLETFLKADPRNLDASLALANLEVVTGERVAAIRRLQSATEMHPQSLQAHMLLAQLQLGAGEVNGALTTAEKAYRISPNEVRVLDLLGRAQIAVGDAAGAVTSYTLLTRNAPNSVPALLRLAGALTAARDYRPAHEVVRKALQLFPKSIEAQVQLGVLHLETGRFDEAAEVAVALQKDNPKLAQGYALAGDALMAQKKFAAAAAAFAKADSIASTALLRIKQHQAESQANKSIASDAGLVDWLAKHPGDVDTRIYLADLYLAAGRRKEGIEQYRKVLEAQPRNARALNNLAWMLHEEKDPTALKYAQEAFQVEQSGVIADTLGWILLGQNKLDEALSMLSRAASMLPNEPEVAYHYAEALVRVGDHARARIELERILRPGTKFPSADAARKLLERMPN